MARGQQQKARAKDTFNTYDRVSSGGGGGGGGRAGGGGSRSPAPVIGTQGIAGGNIATPGGAPGSGMNEFYDQVGDWYQGGITEKGLLAEDYRYDPELINIEELNYANPYDFDPMRSQSMNRLDQQQSSGYQTALTNMAASGGLTAADRMAMASSMNRGGMGARGDLLGKIGLAESENIWETQQSNDQLRNKAYLQNLEMMNKADAVNIDTLRSERDKLYDISRDLYGDDKADKRFDAQMEHAAATARMQEEMAKGENRDWWEQMMDPLDIGTGDATKKLSKELGF